MKKFLIAMVMYLTCIAAFAGSIQHLVFFGDSLSDNGNLYKLLVNFLPKSPPYYQGRFTNGPTWAEQLSKYYYDRYFIDSKIYAFGGATAVYHHPKVTFVAPTNLTLELNEYLLENAFKDKSNTLFFIWIGANDYLFDQQADIELLTTKVVENIEQTIKKLYEHGGRYFVIANVPDLAQVPLAQSGSPTILHEMSKRHNEKLNEKIKLLKQNLTGISLDFVDIYSLFTDVIQDPEKYNQKYNIHITDTKQACWPGGYFLKNIASEEMIAKDLQEHFNKMSVHNQKDYDLKAINDFIRAEPEIRQAYAVSKLWEKGAIQPCTNSDEHLFWDQVHPTQIVHKILADIIKENISQEIRA